MNLQSYLATADLGSLSNADVAGLAPYFIGRPVSNEVVVIAASAERPYLTRAVPINGLGDEFTCGIAAAYWAHSSADRFYLIGHADESDVAAAAITGLGEALQPSGSDRELYLIHLDPTRARWHDPFDETPEWEPIQRPDPLAGRLAALVFHTAAVATREAEAFAPRRSRFPGHELSEYQGGIAMLRSYVPDSPQRADADRQQLECVLDAKEADTAVDLVYLGLALESNPGLTQAALARIWDAETEADAGVAVWTEIARITRGSVRATACALAALAAWRHEDPLAPIAAREAVEADADCPIAQAAVAIVASGALAANFEGGEALAFLAEPENDLEGAHADAGEVA
ncbi:hypothetical protein GCM10029992_37590 [Glycomyces albus]